MKISQLTETNPIELARAVLTADDVKDFPIIHYAAVQLLNALKTFEVEASYFEYEEPDEVAADMPDTPDIIMISRACFHGLAQDEKLAQDFAKSLTNSIFGRMGQGKKHGEE
jgi:hypothetical protein